MKYIRIIIDMQGLKQKQRCKQIEVYEVLQGRSVYSTGKKPNNLFYYQLVDQVILFN